MKTAAVKHSFQHLSAAVFGIQSLELSWLVILLVFAHRNCWLLSILMD